MSESTAQVIDSLFEAKPEEKRKEWIKVLNDEEFDTIEDLKQASEAGISLFFIIFFGF